MKADMNVRNTRKNLAVDPGVDADSDAVGMLARLIHAQMNAERRPMHVAIKMAKRYFAHICTVLIEEGLRRPEQNIGACEATLSRSLDNVVADLDDVAVTIAEAKIEQRAAERHEKLSDVEEGLDRVTDALEQIEEDHR